MDRSELKVKAKAVLRKSYWRAFVVALILSLVSGRGVHVLYSMDSAVVEIISQALLLEHGNHGDSVAIIGSADGPTSIFVNRTYSGALERPAWMERGMSPALVAAVVVTLLCILVAGVIAMIFYVFITARLEVGVSRFFLRTMVQDEPIGTVWSVMDGGYGNVSKVMFRRWLYLAPWILIPVAGFFIYLYKSYRYRMVPYILAENPQMEAARVFALSKQMTDGYRMDLFVLDCSFIGWICLCALTMGLGAYFLAPYMWATGAQCYVRLSEAAIVNGLMSREEILR